MWQVLQKSGEVAISKLPNMLKESDAITYQALDWLARGAIAVKLFGPDLYWLRRNAEQIKQEMEAVEELIHVPFLGATIS